jgi:hypothetical protein
MTHWTLLEPFLMMILIDLRPLTFDLRPTFDGTLDFIGVSLMMTFDDFDDFDDILICVF